jgi:ATP-dependent DNA ligase
MIGKRTSSKYQARKRTGASVIGSRLSSIRSKNLSSAGTLTGRIAEIFWRSAGGFYEGKNLELAGRVGTGFSQKTLTHPLFRDKQNSGRKCSFYNLPAAGRNRWDQGMTAAEMKRCHWVTPMMVCQIKFTEFTRIVGSASRFREEKNSEEEGELIVADSHLCPGRVSRSSFRSSVTYKLRLRPFLLLTSTAH